MTRKYPAAFQMDTCRLQSRQKAFAPSSPAIGGRWTGEEADALVSALNEMLGSDPSAAVIIEVNAIEHIPSGLTQAAIDQYDRRQVRDSTDQLFIFQAGATQDQS